MLAFSVPPGYRPERSAATSEARSVHRHHRLDLGRGPIVSPQAAPHGKEDLRTFAGRVWVHWRLHCREGLRSPAPVAGDVRAAGSSAGPCPGRFRRGDGGNRLCRAEKVHFFAFDLPHSDACFVKAYLVDQNDFNSIAPVIGEYFSDINPLNTTVEARLVDPRMKVEIEITAYRGA